MTGQLHYKSMACGIILSCVLSAGLQAGAFTDTELPPYYVAINGQGWFLVRDPQNGDNLVTRSGELTTDSSSHLQNFEGLHFQGFNNSSLTSIGDIQIAALDGSAFVNSWTITTNGLVQIGLSNGTEFVAGQIVLQNFGRPQNLQRVGHNLFLADSNCLPLSIPSPPGTSGLGFTEFGDFDLEPEPPLLSPLPDAKRAGPLAEGVITQTPNATDLAISGRGFFLLRDPRTSELFATRAGFFLVDASGFLITVDGKRVQGMSGMPQGITGDVKIDGEGGPSSSSGVQPMYFQIQLNGNIEVYLSDGTDFVRSTITLYDFSEPSRLRNAGLGQFKAVAAAGPFVLENTGRWLDGSSRIVNGLELLNVPRDLLALRQRFSFFSQQRIAPTPTNTDLSIIGPGFFLLRNPANNRKLVTRLGGFHLSGDGFLVNDLGWRLQGFSDPAFSQIGDVQVNVRGAPSASPQLSVTNFWCDIDGKIRVVLTGGTWFYGGQILLQNFAEPFRLRPVGNGLFGNLTGAKSLPLGTPPPIGEYATIQQNSLESAPQRENLILPSREGFRFSISGEPGSLWIVQVSDNLINWKNIGRIPDAPFESEFVDRTAPLERSRYYRVIGNYPAGFPETDAPESNVLYGNRTREIGGMLTPGH